MNCNRLGPKIEYKCHFKALNEVYNEFYITNSMTIIPVKINCKGEITLEQNKRKLSENEEKCEVFNLQARNKKLS